MRIAALHTSRSGQLRSPEASPLRDHGSSLARRGWGIPTPGYAGLFGR